jgi:hypothetical protein
MSSSTLGIPAVEDGYANFERDIDTDVQGKYQWEVLYDPKSTIFRDATTASVPNASQEDIDAMHQLYDANAAGLRQALKEDGTPYASDGLKPNLVLNSGLDKLSCMASAQVSQWAVAGTGKVDGAGENITKPTKECETGAEVMVLAGTAGSFLAANAALDGKLPGNKIFAGATHLGDPLEEYVASNTKCLIIIKNFSRELTKDDEDALIYWRGDESLIGDSVALVTVDDFNDPTNQVNTGGEPDFKQVRIDRVNTFLGSLSGSDGDTYQFLEGDAAHINYKPASEEQTALNNAGDMLNSWGNNATDPQWFKFELHHVQQIDLQTPYKMAQFYMEGRDDSTESVFCGTRLKYHNDDADGDIEWVELVRTYDFYMELTPTTYREIGFMESPAADTLFSRIVLDEEIHLTAGQFLRLSYHLFIKQTPSLNTDDRDADGASDWPTDDFDTVNRGLLSGWGGSIANVPATGWFNNTPADPSARLLCGREKLQRLGLAAVSDSGVAEPWDESGLCNEIFSVGSIHYGPGYGWVNRWKNGTQTVMHPADPTVAGNVQSPFDGTDVINQLDEGQFNASTSVLDFTMEKKSVVLTTNADLIYGSNDPAEHNTGDVVAGHTYGTLPSLGLHNYIYRLFDSNGYPLDGLTSGATTIVPSVSTYNLDFEFDSGGAVNVLDREIKFVITTLSVTISANYTDKKVIWDAGTTNITLTSGEDHTFTHSGYDYKITYDSDSDTGGSSNGRVINTTLSAIGSPSVPGTGGGGASQQGIPGVVDLIINNNSSASINADASAASTGNTNQAIPNSDWSLVRAIDATSPRPWYFKNKNTGEIFRGDKGSLQQYTTPPMAHIDNRTWPAWDYKSWIDPKGFNRDPKPYFDGGIPNSVFNLQGDVNYSHDRSVNIYDSGRITLQYKKAYTYNQERLLGNDSWAHWYGNTLTGVNSDGYPIDNYPDASGGGTALNFQDSGSLDNYCQPNSNNSGHRTGHTGHNYCTKAVHGTLTNKWYDVEIPANKTSSNYAPEWLGNIAQHTSYGDGSTHGTLDVYSQDITKSYFNTHIWYEGSIDLSKITMQDKDGNSVTAISGGSNISGAKWEKVGDKFYDKSPPNIKAYLKRSKKPNALYTRNASKADQYGFKQPTHTSYHNINSVGDEKDNPFLFGPKDWYGAQFATQVNNGVTTVTAVSGIDKTAGVTLPTFDESFVDESTPFEVDISSLLTFSVIVNQDGTITIENTGIDSKLYDPQAAGAASSPELTIHPGDELILRIENAVAGGIIGNPGPIYEYSQPDQNPHILGGNIFNPPYLRPIYQNSETKNYIPRIHDVKAITPAIGATSQTGSNGSGEYFTFDNDSTQYGGEANSVQLWADSANVASTYEWNIDLTGTVTGGGTTTVTPANIYSKPCLAAITDGTGEQSSQFMEPVIKYDPLQQSKGALWDPVACDPAFVPQPAQLNNTETQDQVWIVDQQSITDGKPLWPSATTTAPEVTGTTTWAATGTGSLSGEWTSPVTGIPVHISFDADDDSVMYINTTAIDPSFHLTNDIFPTSPYPVNSALSVQSTYNQLTAQNDYQFDSIVRYEVYIDGLVGADPLNLILPPGTPTSNTYELLWSNRNTLAVSSKVLRNHEGKLAKEYINTEKVYNASTDTLDQNLTYSVTPTSPESEFTRSIGSLLLGSVSGDALYVSSGGLSGSSQIDPLANWQDVTIRIQRVVDSRALYDRLASNIVYWPNWQYPDSDHVTFTSHPDNNETGAPCTRLKDSPVGGASAFISNIGPLSGAPSLLDRQYCKALPVHGSASVTTFSTYDKIWEDKTPPGATYKVWKLYSAVNGQPFRESGNYIPEITWGTVPTTLGYPNDEGWILKRSKVTYHPAQGTPGSGGYVSPKWTYSFTPIAYSNAAPTPGSYASNVNGIPPNTNTSSNWVNINGVTGVFDIDIGTGAAPIAPIGTTFHEMRKLQSTGRGVDRSGREFPLNSDTSMVHWSNSTDGLTAWSNVSDVLSGASFESPLIKSIYKKGSNTLTKFAQFESNFANRNDWSVVGIGPTSSDPIQDPASMKSAARWPGYMFIFSPAQVKLDTHVLRTYFKYTWDRDLSS